MAAVLMIGVAQKAAAARLRISADFGDDPLLIDGFTVSSFDVTASPSGLTLTGKQLDYDYQVSAFVSGGVSGTTYELTYVLVLNDPDASEIVGIGSLEVL